jgi:ketosteroid isomerase-like protein
MPNPTDTVRQFVAAINAHDVAAIAALLSDDHVFIDSLGQRVEGAQTMRAGWRGYFAMCPDYRIRLNHVMSEGDTVLASGAAGGTIDGAAWQTPAAWQAIVRGGLIAEWRVFADNKPVYEIIARRK